MNLPVDHLSNSSINTLRRCPEQWRRKYIARQYDPPNGAMTIGKTIGAAEAQSDFTWIESGEPLSTDDVLDAHADEWTCVDQSEVNWQGNDPIQIRESGEAALKAYHRDVLPETPAPVQAEREIRFDAVDDDTGDSVEFVAYLDVELADGSVVDRKVKGKKLSQAEADSDTQPTSYLLSRRTELDGSPAPRFLFDVMNRGVKVPYAERVETTRSDDELDNFMHRILGAAEEIRWRAETDQWSYAPPGAWWCGEKSCGYWNSCPGGGLLRRRAAEAVREGEIAAMAEATS